MNEKPHSHVTLPGQPTDAPPGSARKVRVLMERAARREPLFHPGDNIKRPLPVVSVMGEEPEDTADQFDMEMVG